MQTIFANQFTYTKEYYKKYYQYTCFKRPIMLTMNVRLSINFIVSLLSIMFPQLKLYFDEQQKFKNWTEKG
jgi:hypothetical protein